MDVGVALPDADLRHGAANHACDASDQHLQTSGRGVTSAQHTHTVDDKHGTAKGGLGVLNLVRCKAEQKQMHAPPAPGAFLQCKEQEQWVQLHHPKDEYSLWQRSAAQPEACSGQRQL